MPLPRRSLVSVGILAVALLARVTTAFAQPAPDDEPLPPAIGRPPASPPPPAAASPPPPAASPPPAAAPARAEEPLPRPSSAGASTTAATLEATSTAVPGGTGAAAGRSDPDSLLTSLTGQIGLYHVSTAEVGPAGHLRFGLHGQFFRANKFLLEGATKAIIKALPKFEYGKAR